MPSLLFLPSTGPLPILLLLMTISPRIRSPLIPFQVVLRPLVPVRAITPKFPRNSNRRRAVSTLAFIPIAGRIAKMHTRRIRRTGGLVPISVPSRRMRVLMLRDLHHPSVQRQVNVSARAAIRVCTVPTIRLLPTEVPEAGLMAPYRRGTRHHLPHPRAQVHTVSHIIGTLRPRLQGQRQRRLLHVLQRCRRPCRRRQRQPRQPRLSPSRVRLPPRVLLGLPRCPKETLLPPISGCRGMIATWLRCLSRHRPRAGAVDSRDDCAGRCPLTYFARRSRQRLPTLPTVS